MSDAARRETPESEPAAPPVRCAQCGGAPGEDPADRPSPAAAPEPGIPAGTHCEWCGAEFPEG